jgi:hypothetical protein
LINEENHEVHFSILLKWFQSNFCESKNKLPETVLRSLKTDKKGILFRMIEKASLDRKPIFIKFQTYSWTADSVRPLSCVSKGTSVARILQLSLLETVLYIHNT